MTLPTKMNKQSSLDLLRSLTGSSRANRRSKDLLTDPISGSSEEWFMYVPPCFNEALDIKYNCGAPNPGWTQSGRFAFKTADTIYNTRDTYSVWSDALRVIQLAVVVRSASPAGIGDNGARYRGQVSFAVLLPSIDRSTLDQRFEHTLTQDEFIEFLIVGPTGEFDVLLSENSQAVHST